MRMLQPSGVNLTDETRDNIEVRMERARASRTKGKTVHIRQDPGIVFHHNDAGSDDDDDVGAVYE